MEHDFVTAYQRLNIATKEDKKIKELKRFIALQWFLIMTLLTLIFMNI